MSLVEVEANSFAANGPVISVSDSRGGDRKVSGSPSASKDTDDAVFSSVHESVGSSLSAERNMSVQLCDASGHVCSFRTSKLFASKARRRRSKTGGSSIHPLSAPFKKQS